MLLGSSQQPWKNLIWIASLVREFLFAESLKGTKYHAAWQLKCMTIRNGDSQILISGKISRFTYWANNRATFYMIARGMFSCERAVGCIQDPRHEVGGLRKVTPFREMGVCIFPWVFLTLIAFPVNSLNLAFLEISNKLGFSRFFLIFEQMDFKNVCFSDPFPPASFPHTLYAQRPSPRGLCGFGAGPCSRRSSCGGRSPPRRPSWWRPGGRAGRSTVAGGGRVFFCFGPCSLCYSQRFLPGGCFCVIQRWFFVCVQTTVWNEFICKARTFLLLDTRIQFFMLSIFDIYSSICSVCFARSQCCWFWNAIVSYISRSNGWWMFECSILRKDCACIFHSLSKLSQCSETHQRIALIWAEVIDLYYMVY